MGGYLGTQPAIYLFELPPLNSNQPAYSSDKTIRFKYGIQANLHPLQLIIPEGHLFRFDLYLIMKVGGIYAHLPENALNQRRHDFDYDIGAGLAYHFYRHWGLFTEYNTLLIERFYLEPKFRYGISIKF